MFRKDIYTEEYLQKLGLNERQIKAVIYVKEKGKISNAEYQNLSGVSRITSSRELRSIVDKGIFQMVGRVGKGTKYILKESIAS